MSPPPPHPPLDLSSLELGRDEAVLDIHGLAECRAAALSMARQFRRTLDITSRDLDPRLYDDADFVEAVRSTVINNRRARVRILVKDPGPALRRGHRLVDVAMRLSSFIEVRVFARQHGEHNRAMLVADALGSVNRPLADRFEATACFSSRALAGELLREFEEMWLPARTDPGLRRLHV